MTVIKDKGDHSNKSGIKHYMKFVWQWNEAEHNIKS